MPAAVFRRVLRYRVCLLLALAHLLPVRAWAQIQNVQFVGATATQAVISFDVPDPTNCTVQVSTDPTFATLANDTNPLLFPGSGNCNRASAVVNGNHVVFVAGTRTSALGSDGLFHSLALEADQLYYYRIISQSTRSFTCTAGVNCIQTVNPPLGNTYPEPAPFNSQAPFNFAWPTIRPGVDRNQWFVDPLTGIQVSMLSGPEPAGLGSSPETVSGAPALAAFDAAGNGNWAPSGIQAANSGANQDPLFVRLSPWCVGSGTSYVQRPGSALACTAGQGTWTTAGIDQTYVFSIDDIQSQISAACTGATTSYQFSLTVDGVNPGTDWQTQACTSSTANYTYPPTGTASGGVITTPGFPSTQFGTGSQATTFGYWFANAANNRLARPDLQPHSGTVTVDGSGNVAWASGETFRMSSVSVGSYLTLAVSSVNTDYKITAVNSPRSLAIANPPAAGTYGYLYQQFGVLVRKSSATSGTLTVSNAQFTDYESAINASPLEGLAEVCATYTVTDTAGDVLRPCMFNEAFRHVIYVINESTGVSHFIGLAEASGGCGSGTCAPGVTSHLNDYGLPVDAGGQGSMFFASSAANHWLNAATDASGNLVAIDGSYNPGGSGVCPNDWREITRANCPSYPSNDNMTWYNATPKVGADGLDHTPVTAATNYASANSLSGFYPSQLGGQYALTDPVDPVNGWVEFLFAPANQNAPTWFVKLDPSNHYAAVAMGNSYTNYNCRFCTDHGSGSLAGYEFVATEPQFSICSGVGCGPMVLQSVTSTDNMTQNTCTGITDPNYTSFNGLSRCFTLTLSGQDPCHTTPNGTEVAPMYGTCSWNGSYAHLAGVNVAVGDMLGDATFAGSSGSSGEMFRVVSISSPNIEVIRAYGTPAVQLGTGGIASTLMAHTAPWQLTELCNDTVGAYGGQTWWNLSVDPTMQSGKVDWPWLVAGHLDFWTTGVGAEVYKYKTYSSLGAFVGSPNTFLAQQEGPFNGVIGGGGASFYLQSHESVSRDSNHPNYAVDSNPYSNSAVATNTLWNQTANNVAGSLWHIAAANVQNGGASWPAAIKSIPFVAWSGGYLLQDVSGPSSNISGTSADNWKFCVVYLSGECYSGSAVGDVYLNIPQSAHNGVCGPWDYSRNICATLLDQVAGSINSYDFSGAALGQCGVTTCPTLAPGTLFRRLSGLFNRYDFQSVFSSAHGSFGGQWAFAHSDYYGWGLRTDLFLVKLPKQAFSDSVARNGFVGVPVSVGSISDAGVNARIRFGYAENGPAAAFYCAYNRKEACINNPLPTPTNPYFFASDSGQSVVNCPTGCVLTVPVIPGRVAYYAVDRVDGSGNVIDAGQTQVAFVP